MGEPRAKQKTGGEYHAKEDHDPQRTDELYVCKNYPKCNCYVGMRRGTRIPLGTLADGDLRHLRIRAHRKFDQIWQSGAMSRDAAYHWLAAALGIPYDQTHIGQFGTYRCQEVIEKCDRILAMRQSAQTA